MCKFHAVVVEKLTDDLISINLVDERSAAQPTIGCRRARAELNIPELLIVKLSEVKILDRHFALQF